MVAILPMVICCHLVVIDSHLIKFDIILVADK